MLLAAKGERLTCQRLHHIATANRDIHSGEILSAEPFDWEIVKPQVGTTPQPCECGAIYFARQENGLMQLHIEDEWRPRRVEA